MQASSLPPSFLDSYWLSMSFLGCNAFCVVINIFVLSFVCLSSSLAHFKNGLEYLTRGTALVFIPLMRSLRWSFEQYFRSSGLLFSYFFLYLRLFYGVRFQFSQVLVVFQILSWFGNFIPSVICLFPLFGISLLF